MRLVRRKKIVWARFARRMVAVALVCVFASALRAQQVPPKPPTPTTGNGNAPQSPPPAPDVAPLRVKVNLVLVPVVVRDSSGKAIGTLKREDFRVTDNKREQQLTEFQVEESTKADASAPAAGSSGGSAAVKNFVPPERFTGLFIDDIHLDPAQLSHVTKAVQHYLDGVNLTEQRIGLLTSTGQGQMDFSADLAGLRAAVTKLRAHPLAGSNLKDCPDVSYYDADMILNHGDRAALDAATGEAASVCGVKDPRAAEEVARAAARRRLESGDLERTTVLATFRRPSNGWRQFPGNARWCLCLPGFC